MWGGAISVDPVAWAALGLRWRIFVGIGWLGLHIVWEAWMSCMRGWVVTVIECVSLHHQMARVVQLVFT